jgi:geranylgeranyl pyrophosphate synthase
VLTGDFLFARAAKLAADTNSIPVMGLFSQTLAIIVNGEITQLFSHRCQVNRQDYYQRIYAKTASLFEASTCCAALIADVTDEMIEVVRRYGYNIGMAFQIVDDVFDFVGDQVKIGKPVGNDLRQGLITLPTIYYVEDHPDDTNAQEIINGECLKYEQQVTELVDNIRSSLAVQEALNEADSYVAAALDLLKTLPDKPERAHLEDLTRYITSRSV